MQGDLYQTLTEFMEQEKLTLRLSIVSGDELWLDGPEKKIIMKIIVDRSKRRVSYDVYSVVDEQHVREKTVREMEENVYMTEEHRRWKTAEVLEEVWMVIDELEFWSEKNKYSLQEANLI